MTDFLSALKTRKGEGLIPVIPDIKCFSPKEGDLLKGRDPVRIAKDLEAAGACVISVVTEESEFHGSLKLLKDISNAVNVPILRKDFINSEDDLIQTKEAGASAVLLICSCLDKTVLTDLYRKAVNIGITPFVETHTAEELAFARALEAPLVGINNRDILMLEKDDGGVSHAAGLIGHASEGAFTVIESGLTGGHDVRKAIRHGADAVLVGTAILDSSDPVSMYRSMTRPCDLKICGIMDETGVDLATGYHSDILGFVTEYPVQVPWNLDRKRASLLIEYAKKIRKSPSSSPKTCIVTGGDPEQIISLACELEPDMIQLHYTESLDDTRMIADRLRRNNIDVIRSIPSNCSLRHQMFGTGDAASIVKALDKTTVKGMLFDSRDAVNAVSGGESILNFTEISDIKKQALSKYLMIGGGISAANIREVLTSFSTDCVDVMTATETSPGNKSEEMIAGLVTIMETMK